ncbi:peptidoglycan editing factor PgeF [Vitreimonas flagellata]|uniref:peptidoglycan editing factor PgeF n=1 Tax=Vitreimonas flagellata TaxID=2560861 RepID=UPI001EF9129E|nr:peptidoglycan editing factor PgeF [Vitreimonas flagellata]
MNEPAAARADALAHVRHGFFGRRGGVSEGIYASLNAGVGSKDDADAVRENRGRIAASFGVEPHMLVGVHQVHSPDAVFIDAPWSRERPHADALVTTNPKLVLSVLTADCGPVLLADKDAGVIAAAHAGWRGAFGGVLASTMKLMIEHGARADRICAAIGPCIQQPSYEVGADFRGTFLSADSANARFFSDEFGPRPHFDLPAFCAHQLALLGVGDVEIIDIDTFRDETYFSHRRSMREAAPDYGRNCAAICLG